MTLHPACLKCSLSRAFLYLSTTGHWALYSHSPPPPTSHSHPPAQVFLEQSLPVIEHYRALGKVHTIDTNRPVDTIYQEVRQVILALGSADN